MTNPNTYTTNAMQSGVALADPDKADSNFEYLKYEIDYINLIGFVQNLVSNQDTDTNHDMKIDRQSTNYPAYILMTDNAGNYKTVIFDNTAIIKAIDDAWAAGKTAGAGGLATGVSLSSGLTLHQYLLCKEDFTTFEAGFDSSVTAANLLATSAVSSAGYAWRSVSPITSFILDASSNIINHKAREVEGGALEVIYDVVSYVESTNPGTSAFLQTLVCPPNSIAKVTVFFRNTYAGDVYALITETTQTDTAPSSSYAHIIVRPDNSGGLSGASFELKVDSNHQIRVRLSASNSGGWLRTNLIGYKLIRRV